MDELIDRARRGEASADELAQLDSWRRSSGENERQYHQTLRVLTAGRSLGATEGGVPQPTAAAIVARASSRRRFAGQHGATRWAPWAIAAAAAIVAAVSLRSRAVTSEPIPGWGATEVVTGAAELATV